MSKRITIAALILAGLLIALPVSLRASEDDAAKAADDAHAAAALKLIQAMKVDANFESMMVDSVDVQVQANPVLLPYRDVMVEWAKKHMRWEYVEKDFTALYMKHFTTEELNAATEFYQTPIGQKFVAKMPDLFKEGGEIGMRLGQEKAPKLQEMIQAQQQAQPQ